jgi:hypothetical protein
MGELVRRVGVILQSDRSPVFSGSSADLGRWFDDIEHGCDQNQIPSTQRAGAAILLLIFNGTPFRAIMQERKRNYLEQSNADYWPWGEFKTDLESVVRAAEDAQNSTHFAPRILRGCTNLSLDGGDIDWARVGRIGLRVAQGALFVPLIGIATLNIIGFTAGGVLAGQNFVQSSVTTRVKIGIHRICRRRPPVCNLWGCDQWGILSPSIHWGNCHLGGTSYHGGFFGCHTLVWPWGLK